MRGDNRGHAFLWNIHTIRTRYNPYRPTGSRTGWPANNVIFRLMMVGKEGHIDMCLARVLECKLTTGCEMQAGTSCTPPRQRIFRRHLTLHVVNSAQCAPALNSAPNSRGHAYKLKAATTNLRGSAITCRALPVALPPAEATAILACTSIMGLMATLPGLLMIHGGFARAGQLCPLYTC